MNEIIAIDIKVLITMCMIVSIQTIGCLQWLKNFSKCGKSCTICRICRKQKKYAIWAVVILAPCALMNTTLVPPLATAVFDVIFLGLAIEQLAYQAITNGVPKVINSLFDKAAGIKILNLHESESSTGGET